MTVKDIARLIPTIQAAKLLEHNVKAKKKSAKDLIKLGTEDIIGLSLIKIGSDFIEEL